MARISATLDRIGVSGLVLVNIEDILLLGVESRTSTILIYTKEAIYYTTGTLNYWTPVLNNSGYRFILADRTNSLNIDNISEISEKAKIAYFHGADRSIQGTLSRSGMEEVKDAMNLYSLPVIRT